MGDFNSLTIPVTTPLIPGRWLVTALVFSGLAVAIMMIQTGIMVTPDNRGFAVAFMPLLALAGVRFRLRQPTSLLQKQVHDFSENFGVFLTICLLGVIASYPAAAETTGFADPALQHMDKLLHFDWLAWYREVCEYPVLQRVGSAAYATIYFSPLLLLGWFAATQRSSEARRFLATFWVAEVITLMLFPLFPAEGPLAYLWHGSIPYMPTSALYQEQLIPALRSHRFADIDLGSLRGLICAPSFHSASAVLYVAAAWPIARLRWIAAVVNLAMLLATPIEGTHYLADMIAGFFVAMAAILAVRLALRLLWRNQSGPADLPVVLW